MWRHGSRVSPINAPGIELYSYANVFFCLGWKPSSLITWMKTLYCATPLLGRFWSMMFFNLKSVRHVASVWTTQVFSRSKMWKMEKSSNLDFKFNKILLEDWYLWMCCCVPLHVRRMECYGAFIVSCSLFSIFIALFLQQNLELDPWVSRPPW